MNMHTAKGKEDKWELTQLRKEIYEWKKKYYACRRKVAAV